MNVRTDVLHDGVLVTPLDVMLESGAMLTLPSGSSLQIAVVVIEGPAVGIAVAPDVVHEYRTLIVSEGITVTTGERPVG